MVRSSLAVVLICAFAAPAQAQPSQVVPNAFANVPGTTTFLGPLANSQRTYQQLIHESQLSDLVGLPLTGIKWRIPTSATSDWPAADVTFSNYDIYLSGSVDPSMRSLTFADNVVGPQTQVRAGTLDIPAGSYTFGNTPNAFGPEIKFDSLWTYSGGNLLVEIRHLGFTGTSRNNDAMLATGGAAQGYGTLFSAAWTGNYMGTSGSQGNFALIEITAIPEPASLGLVFAGAALLAVRRRRAG